VKFVEGRWVNSAPLFHSRSLFEVAKAEGVERTANADL